MKRMQWLLGITLLVLLCLPTYSLAQDWSGILNPSRATNWSNAGVAGGIPNRTVICATLNPGATSAQINSAIASCPTNQVVFLNAGTYNLSGGITFGGHSGVTLRGAGANQTFLNFTSNGVCGLKADICIWSGDYSDSDNVENSANWTAGYAPGTTVITLSSTANLAVGNIIHLDQLSEATDGYPGPGDIYICSKGNVCVGQGGDAGNRAGRGNLQLSVVTAVNGNNVTISPGLVMPNWRAGQSPQAWWPNSIVHDDGIEDLSVNNPLASLCQTCGGIVIFNARNCWVKGIRNIEPNPTDGTPLANHIWLDNTMFITIRDSYFYGSNNHSQSYGIELMPSQWTLIENNIFQHITSNVVNNGPAVGNVIGYNFSIDDNYTAGGASPGYMQASFTMHEVGTAMELYEGNSGLSFVADNIHGTHHFGTLYRNHFYGDIWNNPTKNAGTAIIQLEAYSRFFNFIGNVLGRSGYYNNYQSNNETSVFSLNGITYPGVSYGSDARTKITAMRWGNWDTVTNAARFCGNSSNTGWATTCASTSEVPTGLANYANPVPTKGDTGAGQPPLPASFYLNSQPPWWTFSSGTPAPFPAVGPDVTGGNISGFGGHAYMIPARNCWTNIMNGVLGSSGALTFSASTCYGQQNRPAPPTNVSVIVN